MKIPAKCGYLTGEMSQVEMQLKLDLPLCALGMSLIFVEVKKKEKCLLTLVGNKLNFSMLVELRGSGVSDSSRISHTATVPGCQASHTWLRVSRKPNLACGMECRMAGWSRDKEKPEFPLLCPFTSLAAHTLWRLLLCMQPRKFKLAFHLPSAAKSALEPHLC